MDAEINKESFNSTSYNMALNFKSSRILESDKPLDSESNKDTFLDL